MILAFYEVFYCSVVHHAQSTQSFQDYRLLYLYLDNVKKHGRLMKRNTFTRCSLVDRISHHDNPNLSHSSLSANDVPTGNVTRGKLLEPFEKPILSSGVSNFSFTVSFL